MEISASTNYNLFKCDFCIYDFRTIFFIVTIASHHIEINHLYTSFYGTWHKCNAQIDMGLFAERTRCNSHNFIAHEKI